MITIEQIFDEAYIKTMSGMIAKSTTVYEIRTWLREIKRHLQTGSLWDVVDPHTFPSEPIPPDLNPKYPIWAVDRDGYALVGDSFDEIAVITTGPDGRSRIRRLPHRCPRS